MIVEILQGLPASGKSTYAKSRVQNGNGTVKRLNKDSLRIMVDDGVWNKKSEKNIIQLRNAMLATMLQEGYDVVIDDTNFYEDHIKTITAIAESHGASVVVTKFTDVPVATCIERDCNRESSVGRNVIISMAKKYLPDQYLEYEQHIKAVRSFADEHQHRHVVNYNETEHRKKCIICDLDGTLCLLNGRNPYDASRCADDILNTPVADVLCTMANTEQWHVLYVSGREEKYRRQTMDFFAKHYHLPLDGLLMRPTGDRRKDAVVKKELYDNHIAPHYSVQFVFDDRNSVVDMWRNECKLTVFQVNYGDF